MNEITNEMRIIITLLIIVGVSLFSVVAVGGGTPLANIYYDSTTNADNSYTNLTNIFVSITHNITSTLNISFNLYNSSNSLINSTILTNNTYSELCRQETANVSTSCGGLSTGSYSFTNFTFYQGQFNINYSKPSLSVNAIWQVKHGKDGILYNITISDSCFNFNATLLQLRFIMGETSGANTNSISYGQCQNSSGWNNISNIYTGTGGGGVGSGLSTNRLIDADYSVAGGFDWDGTTYHWADISGVGYNDAMIYEEAIYWNVSQIPKGSYSINFTGLTSNTNYYFNVTACNSTYCNSTSTRNVTLDNTAPLISFNSNTYNTSSFKTLFINFSHSDTNLDYTNLFIYNSTLQRTYKIFLSNPYNNTIGSASCSGICGGSSFLHIYNLTNLGMPLIQFINNSEQLILFNLDTSHTPSYIKVYNSSNPSGILINATYNYSFTPSIDAYVFNVSRLDNYNQISLYNEYDSVTYNYGIIQWNYNYWNITAFSDGLYYFNATTYDLAGNSNNTETRNATIDNSAPSLTINSPLAQSYYYQNITFNVTSNDTYSSVSSCWYNITNSTNVIVNKTIMTSCGVIYEFLNEDSYTANFGSNDTLNNINLSSVSFSISITKPSVVLNSPSNNYYSNSANITFNFTGTHSTGLDTCKLYTNESGTFSNVYNWTHPTNNTMNSTSRILTDKSYLWNVWCNSSGTGSSNYAIANKTFTIDTVNPVVTINSITTVVGSQTVTINSTINDTNTDTCRYLIYNLAGTIDGTNNDTFTCNSLITPYVSSFATYNLTVSTTDKAGNTASSWQLFTISASGVTLGSGGSSTVIVTSANWSITSESGTGNYQLKMSPGTTRTKELLFMNTATKSRTIKLECRSDTDFCNYVFLKTNTIILPVLSGISQSTTFTINLPKDIAYNTYVANIYATDEEGNSKVVTISTEVSSLGVLVTALTKLGESKYFGTFKLPYILILIGLSLISFLPYRYIFRQLGKNKKGFFYLYDSSLAVFLSLITGFLVVILI